MLAEFPDRLIKVAVVAAEQLKAVLLRVWMGSWKGVCLLFGYLVANDDLPIFQST